MKWGVNYGRRLENSEEGVLTAPRYRVTLTADERWELEALTRAATKTTGKRFLYVLALSLCDQAPGVSARTVERLKRRFLEQRLEFALERKRRVRSPWEVIFDGAHGTCVRRGQPPSRRVIGFFPTLRHVPSSVLSS